jgi:hypothetical protein
VVVALSLLATSGALALADRMIAARGMRWDAMIVPVWVDLDTLRRSPADAEAATDRLLLRCLRQRLTPAQAAACAEILLGLADSQWLLEFDVLLDHVLLRADRVPTAVDEKRLSPWMSPALPPSGSQRPGDQFVFDCSHPERTPWGTAWLVKSVTLGGVPLEVREGRRYDEGTLIEHLDSCSFEVPELPWGVYELELVADHVRFPSAAKPLLLHSTHPTSLGSLGVRILFSPAGSRTALALLPDAVPQKRDYSSVLGPNTFLSFPSFGTDSPAPPWGAWLARNDRLQVITLASIFVALIFFPLWLGSVYVARGKPTLVRPRCARCKGLLHAATTTRCSECGANLTLPQGIVALRFQWQALDVLAGSLLLLMVAPCAVGAAWWMANCDIEYFNDRTRLIERLESQVAALDAQPSDAGITPRDARAIKSTLVLLQNRFGFDALTAPGSDSSNEAEPEARVTRAITRVLERMAAFDGPPPSEMDSQEARLFAFIVAEWDVSSFDESLRLEAFRRSTPPPVLNASRYRAGEWARLELLFQENFYSIPSSRFGVPVDDHVPAKFLVPDVPGPFEVEIHYETELSMDVIDGPVSAKFTLESVCPGEPLCRMVTELAASPFGRPPRLLLHEWDMTADGGSRWFAELRCRLAPTSTYALGRWLIDLPSGSVPIDESMPIPVDVRSFDGGPVTIRFVPSTASEVDPEAAIDWWGREESWQVVPRRVPLGSGS